MLGTYDSKDDFPLRKTGTTYDPASVCPGERRDGGLSQ